MLWLPVIGIARFNKADGSDIFLVLQTGKTNSDRTD